LKQIDAHTPSAAEYEEIPELSQDFFRHADMYRGETLVKRGRRQCNIHSVKSCFSDFSGYGLTKFEIQVDVASHPILITLREQG
jgi:hypothetical protein